MMKKNEGAKKEQRQEISYKLFYVFCFISLLCITIKNVNEVYCGIKEYKSSARYFHTYGTILSKEQEKYSKSSRCTVKYSYSVSGKTLTGNHLGVIPVTTSCVYYDRLPDIGGMISVYYAPQNPEHSFAGRWYPWNSIVAAILSLVLLTGQIWFGKELFFGTLK